MAEERTSSTGWAIAGFVVGSLFGAALALLLTPETGSEMRAKMKDTAEKVKEVALEKAKELLEEARRKIKEEREEETTEEAAGM